MITFKTYISNCLLLEAVYSELENEITPDTNNEFTDLPSSRALKDNHRMLFQVYVVALIVGITKEEIEDNPKIMFDPEVREKVSHLMNDTTFSTDFANLTQDFLDADYVGIDSEKTQRVIQTLTNQYGEVFDKRYSRASV